MKVQRGSSSRRRLGHLLALFGIAAALLLMGPPDRAQAQAALRGPTISNINVGPRVPNLNIGPSLNPHLHYSPNLYGSDAPSGGAPGGAGQGGGAKSSRNGNAGQPRRTATSEPDRRYIAREVLIEIDGSPSDAAADALARRHRLTRLQSQPLPLVGGTLFRWRIPDSRSVENVVRELVADGSVRSAQPNYRFILQQASAASEGDPAQYALASLRLPQAHVLARGDRVTIAVIDSAIDVAHPELAGSIGATLDAVGGNDLPHSHGTGIAAVIAAHGRLMGSSPAVSLVAIRAFGAASSNRAESTSFAVVRSLDFAVSKGARIINMSFAGPQDTLIAKALAAAAAKGVVLVAASGNAGPKSPPLFPAADRNVIAVTATDASDKFFAASNRGSYIALSAPGADILTAAPDAKYQVASGTSFAAAYVSGIVALMLERNPALTPEAVRAILTRTAHDLGAPGRDDLFGAGKADAFAAVTAADAPVATAAGRPGEASQTSTR
jgi:hypothetical protein